MIPQNQNKNLPFQATSRILMWTVVVANLCLATVIWYAEDINALLPASPIPIPTMAAQPAPVVVEAPQPVIPAAPAPTQLLSQADPLPTSNSTYEPPLWDSYGVVNTTNTPPSTQPTQFLIGL